MAWPSSDEFVQAVQNPRSAFFDLELRDGQPELGMWDMPKARSGGFAVVFKLQCSSRNCAVKCFTHDFADHQERYAAISEYLSHEPLPYIVGFAFLPDGIRIRDRTYPILKMEWVEGESLKDYVARHLNRPGDLRDLAVRWAAMVRALEKAGIAHGDLQDQNVIVVHDDLRLIDYDGMFVPSLAGRGSHELGARHYQHPLRTEGDFAPYLDNFSAWVVYLSLVALSVQPDLWQRFGGGDDKLLLSCEDYKEPDNSPVLSALEVSPDEQVRVLTGLFKSLLCLRPEDVPALDNHIETPAIAKQYGVPSWLDDYVSPRHLSGQSVQQTVQVDQSDAAVPDASWIIEGIPEQVGLDPELCFRHSPTPERMALAASIIATVTVVVLCHLGVFGFYPVAGVTIFVLAFNALLLRLRYQSEDSVKAVRIAGVKAQQFTSIQRDKQNQLTDAANAAETIRRTFKNQEIALTAEREDIHRLENKQISKSQQSFDLLLQGVSSKRLGADREYADELVKLRNRFSRKTSDLDRQMIELDSAETFELKNALQDLQYQHIQSFLLRFPILYTEIPKVGHSFRVRLAANGFRTAADIDARVITVSGIGPMRGAALQAWKAGLQGRAQATVPTAIPPSQKALIQAKYQGRRGALRTERDNCPQQLANEERSLHVKYDALREGFGGEEDRLQRDLTYRQTEIRARFRQQVAVLNGRETRARQQCEEDLRKNIEQIAHLRKALFHISWDQARLSRQIESSRNIHFGRYLARVFGN